MVAAMRALLTAVRQLQSWDTYSKIKAPGSFNHGLCTMY